MDGSLVLQSSSSPLSDSREVLVNQWTLEATQTERFCHSVIAMFAALRYFPNSLLPQETIQLVERYMNKLTYKQKASSLQTVIHTLNVEVYLYIINHLESKELMDWKVFVAVLLSTDFRHKKAFEMFEEVTVVKMQKCTHLL